MLTNVNHPQHTKHILAIPATDLGTFDAWLQFEKKDW
jgi:hypothetical protein